MPFHSPHKIFGISYRNFSSNGKRPLCSIHFAPECFTRRIDLIGPDEDLSGNRQIYKGSIPIIDVAGGTTRSTRIKRTRGKNGECTAHVYYLWEVPIIHLNASCVNVRVDLKINLLN